MTSPSTQDAAPSNAANKSFDWLHYLIVFIAFGITGFLSVLFSRFLLTGILDLNGDIWSGPWSYRIAYLLLIPPSYSVTLVLVGSLLGKHAYFKQRVLGMWGRLIPKLAYHLVFQRKKE